MSASPVYEPCRPNDDTARHSGETFLASGTFVGDDDRYRIDDAIAVGGMSAVYRAMDLGTESPCALKVQYLPAVPPEEAAAFQNEARLLASLQFPGIVAVRDLFACGDYSFIAMDFVEGDNLYDRHRRTGRAGEDTENVPISPVPEDQVALYAIALAQTLDHLHTRSPAIVYRDLKPHNVMRRATDGALILLDFGIARRLDMLDRSCINDDVGTPGYAAPEQYVPESTIDARTDIYGLGVLLVELATGYNPRADGAERFVPPLCDIRHFLTPSLAGILQKCLEADPGERHQSAADLLDELHAWKATQRRLRGGSQPKPVWFLATEGQASGPLQAHEGRLYTADAAGACYAIEASVGHIDHELGPPTDMPAGTRYRLLPPLPGARSSATVARIASAPTRSRLLVATELLEPLQQLDVTSDRLLAAWCADGDLILASGNPPRIARLSRGRDGQWYCMWRNKLINEPTALCSCGEDAVLVNSRGVVKRVNVMGERVWQITAPLWENALPSVCCVRRDCIILGAANPTSPLVGLDSATGKLLWQNPTAGRWLGEPLPASGAASVIAATRDAGLIELSLDDGSITDVGCRFPRPLVGVSQFMPASDIVAMTEFGAGGRVLLYDLAHRKLVWSEALGERGAICAPIIVGDMLCAQEIGGCIRAWRWEDWR